MKNLLPNAFPAHRGTTWNDAEGNGDKGVSSFLIVALFSVAAIAFFLCAHFLTDTDYIGVDPDDSMRLVEVRDYLAGQGWFDLHQYRLGLEGGTMMHWSRLIDLPIAALISFFKLFIGAEAAEAAAALVWPLFLIIPLLASMALAGYRLGGRQAMLMTLGLALLFIVALPRFRPGALDHHNVQLVLVAFIAAMLLDPKARARDFALAGISASLALAIGAETTPLIAVAGLIVALLWLSDAKKYRYAAIAFGLALALGSAVFFFATTAPHLYSLVTCDTLSLGYMSLAVTGGLGLTLVAAVIKHNSALVRLIALGAIGVLVFALATSIAPQCLGNPLANLDPLLVKYWLNSVTEAQPITSELSQNPDSFGGFYAVGLIALVVCLTRLSRGEEPIPHAILFGLIAVSWVVSAVQVRGMIFSNLLAAIPLGALMAELRAYYHERKNETKPAVVFIIATLASIPTVWTFAGAGIAAVSEAVGISEKPGSETNRKSCIRKDSVQNLAGLPKGRIFAPSNPGSALLRFTPHDVLNANYHRNQAGMLAALQISLADPQVAAKIIDRAGVNYVLFCDDDPQLEIMRKDAPNGFLARLGDGEIPEFLEPIPQNGEPRMKLFRVLR